MSSCLRQLIPTNAWVRCALVPALVFMALATDQNYLADFWHHLARGRVIATEGRLLDEDRFTFTVPGRPFQDVNWLSQVSYHALYEVGGLSAVRVGNALTLAAALALLTWLCRRRCGSLSVATAVGVLTFFGLWNVLTVRPQTYSMLLFVGLYAALDGAGRRPGLLLLGPPILALWANLHGAFPAGLMLIGAFLTASAWGAWRGGKGVLQDRQTRLLALCLAASTLATLANPYGWGIYFYVGLTANTAAVRQIDEWVPPGLDQWIGVAFFVSLALLACLYAAAWRRLGRGPSARDVCLLGCFLPLACGSVRMVAWWLLVLAPILAELLATLCPRRAEDAAAEKAPSAAAAVVFGLMMLAVVFSLPGLQTYNPLLRVARQGPRVEDDLEAVHRHLEVHAGAGRIFSRFEWGEYLTWSASPSFKVFMDGRIEIYPDEIWARYAAVTCGGAGWERILDEYRVDFLLLDAPYHRRTGLLGRVERSPIWQLAFRARVAVLFVRRPGA